MPDGVLNPASVASASLPSLLSVTHCPPPASRSWAPAQSAYVVQMWRQPGQRLVMLTRGDLGLYTIIYPNNSQLTERQLERLAERKNREIGVPRAAARALGLDRVKEFAEPPVRPTDMAQYYAGEEARRRALRGDRCVNAASDAWIRISIALHYYGPGPHVSSLRYAEMAADLETFDWAREHGRATRRSMTRKERAAFDFLAADRALRDLQRDYRTHFSRWREELCRRSGDKGGAERVLLADQVERRKALLALRTARRPALRKFIASRVVYMAARPDLFAVVRP